MFFASKIELWSIDRIKPFPRNPKQHPDAQVDKIALSITEFGFVFPLLCESDGNLVVGHGRILAAVRLGLKEVPVIPADHLTPAQIKAFRIADNKLNESPWDQALLAEQLKELQDEGANMGALGFESEELDKLLDEFLPQEPPVEDSHGTTPAGKTASAADTQATIGEYRFVIEREHYLEWIEELRQAVGFEKEDIITELKRRLGL